MVSRCFSAPPEASSGRWKRSLKPCSHVLWLSWPCSDAHTSLQPRPSAASEPGWHFEAVEALRTLLSSRSAYVLSFHRGAVSRTVGSAGKPRAASLMVMEREKQHGTGISPDKGPGRPPMGFTSHLSAWLRRTRNVRERVRTRTAIVQMYPRTSDGQSWPSCVN